MTKFFQPSFLLRVVGGAMGLISILGGIAAWRYSDSRELYRYLVAALVMLSSGILWLVCSIIPKFLLSKKQYAILLTVLILGLALGLFDTFILCGGECGFGASFCHWYHGYPGRWLRISTCVAGLVKPIWLRTWRIDFPSFVADLVFWSGVGLIVALIWNAIKGKTDSPAVE